jgi:hypothetical protein
MALFYGDFFLLSLPPLLKVRRFPWFAIVSPDREMARHVRERIIKEGKASD